MGDPDTTPTPAVDPLWTEFDATAPFAALPGQCRVCEAATAARAVCPYCATLSPQSRRQRSRATDLWIDLGAGFLVIVGIGVFVLLVGVLSAGAR